MNKSSPASMPKTNGPPKKNKILKTRWINRRVFYTNLLVNQYSFQTQGILLGLFAMLMFSINDGIFKFAMETMPMNLVVAIGYLFSTIFLVFYARWKNSSLLPNRKRNAVIHGCLFLLEQICFIFALKYLPIAELFIVVLSTPVAVLIMSSVFLKENLSKQQIFAVLLGCSGAMLVVCFPFIFSSPETPHHSGNMVYLAWAAAVLNVLFGSSKIIYLRKYCQTENTISLPIFSNLFILIFFAAQLSPKELSFPVLESTLLLMGGILGGLGCVAYIRAFQMARAPLISATQYSQIICAVLMGLLIFNEELTLASIFGSLLILMSGYFLYLKKSEN